jgi:cellulose synthase/poly-beta-1,6-N-acetylglucosamine synthase-like glycosyltransferase
LDGGPTTPERSHRIITDAPTTLIPRQNGYEPRTGAQVRSMAAEAAEMAKRHALWRPRVRSLVLTFPVLTAVTMYFVASGSGSLAWYISVVWTWPVFANLLGVYGVIRTRRQLHRNRRYLHDAETFRCHDQLVVVVPTIGRHDTYPALERSVLSYVASLPTCFPNMRVDVVIEEGCEARDRVFDLGRRSPFIRVVVVPKAYHTPNGTRFKARANHYSHELRIAEGEARDDVWVLHMDDDTGLALDSAIAMAQFIEKQRWAGDDAKHLAQGILTYPRENAVSRLTWFADAVRPSDDIGRFSALTGHGKPLLGLHGELLLVRASIEATIGWDFGPKAIVEDAQMALNFCRMYPGRSAWFHGRCYGASPATVRDLIKQRERWAWGLVGLAFNRTLPTRYRMLLMYCVVSWVVGPLQNVFFVLFVGAMLGDMNTSPISMALLPMWALNFAFTFWQYWEGLRINASVSQNGRRKFFEPILVIVLIPFLSLLEGIGGFRGFLKFLRGEENKFVVIAKPI